MLGRRLAWAGVAIVAALVALGFAATAATLALTHYFGLLIAFSIMTGVLTVAAGAGFWLAVRKRATDDGEQEPLIMSLARDMIRRQPLSAIALFGALGFAVAKRPQAAAELGRGVAKLVLS